MLQVVVLGVLGMTSDTIRPVDLRCENLTSPAIGIGEPRPSLSWRAIDGQVGYEIEAASSKEKLVDNKADRWRSRRVDSPLNFGVLYGGKPLGSDQATFWRVRLWLQGNRPTEWSEPHVWRTGLLHASDWRAKWIEAPTDRPKPLPANNGFHTDVTSDPTAPKWVTIDLGRSRMISAIILHPAKPFDWPNATIGFFFPKRFVLEVAEDAEFARAVLFHDASRSDYPTPSGPVTFHGKAKGRYVRLRTLLLSARKEGEYGLALAEMQALDGNRVVSSYADVTASDSIETTAWGRRKLVDGDLASHGALHTEAHPAPVFRRQFEVRQGLRRATLYATSHGVYQPLLNGHLLSDQRFATEWTDFRKRSMAQAYDLKLSPGRHILGFLMGDGWFAGRIGMAAMLTGTGMPRYVYGDRLALLAQLHLEYENGEVEIIGTDEAWGCITEGPYLQTDNLDGEIYAADRPVAWQAAAGWSRPRIAAHDKSRIVMQTHPPCRVERLLPLRNKTVVGGKVILDFGQNFAGVVRLTFTAKKGTVIEIRHAEMLQEDGSLYTTNLRDLEATDRVTATGEAGQVYEPLFTFHGFRYAEVSGITSDQIEDAKGVVLTNMPEETGSLICSNDRLNQLWSNSAWTMRSNFLAVPTDCPQRDERLGWTGDIQVFARSATYYADVEAFLEKWCADMRDAQLPDGRYPDIAPHLAPSHAPGSFTGVPAWGDAGVIVPWRIYETYGNKRLLERHFESARRWVDWIDQNNSDHIWRKNRGNDYNDWLNGDTLIAADYPKTGGAIPNELFASLMFAQSAKLVSEMANVLGRQEAGRYRQLFSSIQAAIEKEFIQSDGTVKGDTQAGYGLCLDILELPEDRRQVLAERLKAAIAKYDGRISTGFVSTVPMMQQLVRHGMVEEAFGLLTSRRFPSWLYSVDQGATTIWERWDGWVAGRGFQNPGMNSFNHYAIGAVAEFMMEHVGGIKADGPIVNRRFRIAPIPAGGISWARAKWPTRLGDVRCDWSVDDDVLTIRFEIPSNSTAEVVLPVTASEVIEDAGLAWKNTGKSSTATAVAGEYTVRMRWRKR